MSRPVKGVIADFSVSLVVLEWKSGRIHKSLRHRNGGNATRLCDGDLSVFSDHAGLEKVLRHLGALARPGLAHHDHNLSMSGMNFGD